VSEKKGLETAPDSEEMGSLPPFAAHASTQARQKRFGWLLCGLLRPSLRLRRSLFSQFHKASLRCYEWLGLGYSGVNYPK